MSKSGIIAALALAGIGYAVGFQHGDDTARFDMKAVAAEVIAAPYPYAAVCSDMLEAAWSVQDAAPAGSPHNP